MRTVLLASAQKQTRISVAIERLQKKENRFDTFKIPQPLRPGCTGNHYYDQEVEINGDRSLCGTGWNQHINDTGIASLTCMLCLTKRKARNAATASNLEFGAHAQWKSNSESLTISWLYQGSRWSTACCARRSRDRSKIFDLYLQGKGVRKIKRYLEEHGIKTATGKSEWSTSTIDRMLSNEKYIGQILMQKTYTPDFLTGKQVRNRGNLDMYLLEDAHEPS